MNKNEVVSRISGTEPNLFERDFWTAIITYVMPLLLGLAVQFRGVGFTCFLDRADSADLKVIVQNMEPHLQAIPVVAAVPQHRDHVLSGQLL
jgi:hypothetical protein